MNTSPNFWIQPCYKIKDGWVIYRDYGKEILLIIKDGALVSCLDRLTPEEMEYLKTNLLTNYSNQL